jgi:coproporphyrinogen III oxidase-like Fe-S oxidoreductase
MHCGHFNVGVQHSRTPWLSWALLFLLHLFSIEALSPSAPDSTRIVQGGDTRQASHVGFYVHIPYCRRRCRYCNFAIVPVGSQEKLHESTSFMDVIHQQYQSDLFQEMDLMHPQTQPQPQLTSIYFGGGTPSLAPVSMISGILKRIKNKFVLSNDAEITMEMDPGTFDLQQLQSLKDLGVNRISLGVQSFDNTILEQLGRVHRRADIDEAVQIIHQVFGDRVNYSMDLISGVPSLTEAKWIATLQTATTDFSASHLSIYDLQVEEGTVFETWYANNGSNRRHRPVVPTLPSEESVARMYKFTAGYLRAKGFEHYEGKHIGDTWETMSREK